MSGKRVISCQTAPAAVGAYSQAVLVEENGLLFVSGQIGLDPETMKMVADDVEAQARQVMENVGAILKEAGGDYSSIVKATIYLVDISDFAVVNEVYASYFQGSFPARAAFAVGALPMGARVEIEAIAAP